MKILALDIGSWQVKAVELEVSFGRVELQDYSIERVRELPKIERQILSASQIEALKKLLASRHGRWDRVSVNFPRSFTTTRVYHLPTRDRKTIQSSLAFELDDDIPVSVEDAIQDFVVLGNEGATSTVFTTVALKRDLMALLSELQMLGLDPDIVTIDSWAMTHLLKRAIPKSYEGRPVCIVNLGATQTAIHMHIGADPVLSHVTNCAGVDVTRAIAMAYNLSFDDAEKSKVDGAFVLTNVHFEQAAQEGGTPITAEQKQFSAVIADALSPVVREIKQTIMAYKSQYKLTPRAVFLTGGTSLISNLPLHLEEQLRIPVFPLSYISHVVGQTLQLSELSETQIATATGLALAAVKMDRNYSLNFRKDEFAKRGGLSAVNLKAYRQPLKYVAATLAFIYVNLFAQWIILSARASRQEAQLERSIKSVMGAVSQSVLATYMRSPTALKSAVTKELAKYKEAPVAPAKAPISALEVLNKVSATVPKDMTLDVSVFQIKDGRLKLGGIVDRIASSERIAKALEESKIVTEVTKDKADEDPKTKKVKFEFSAKIAEAGNGKTR